MQISGDQFATWIANIFLGFLKISFESPQLRQCSKFRHAYINWHSSLRQQTRSSRFIETVKDYFLFWLLLQPVSRKNNANDNSLCLSDMLLQTPTATNLVMKQWKTSSRDAKWRTLKERDEDLNERKKEGNLKVLWSEGGNN